VRLAPLAVSTFHRLLEEWTAEFLSANTACTSSKLSAHLKSTTYKETM
jgi:hypothetical protein